MKKLKGEIYLKNPTPFIKANYNQLLPSWTVCPSTLIIFLLFSDQLIDHNLDLVEAEKQRLKDQFLQFSGQLRENVIEQNYLLEIIDPQDGYPINSTQGIISFDIVTMIHQLLGFKISQKQGCTVLHHPTQDTAIYPCLLLTDANIQVMSKLAKQSKLIGDLMLLSNTDILPVTS